MKVRHSVEISMPALKDAHGTPYGVRFDDLRDAVRQAHYSVPAEGYGVEAVSARTAYIGTDEAVLTVAWFEDV